MCIYIWERGWDGDERMGVEANTVRREVWNSMAGVKALVLTVIRASFVSQNVHTKMLKKIFARLNNLFTIYYYNQILKVEILNSWKWQG